MTAVNGATAPGGVGYAGDMASASHPTAGALLPAPTADSVDVGDALNKLLVLSSQMSEQQTVLGKSQADAADAQRKIASEKRREALQRAIEAAEKAREAEEGGFLSFIVDKVAKPVALAALAVSTVVTGGLSAPAVVALVGIGISAGTQVAAETGALQAVFGEEAAAYVAIGGAITGSALTLGGAVWSLASSSQAVAKVAKTGKDLAKVAKVANGAVAIGQGAAEVADGIRGLEHARLQRRADQANIDAQEQRNVLKRIEELVSTIIEDLHEAKESAERATETLQGTMNIHNQTLLQAGAMKV